MTRKRLLIGLGAVVALFALIVGVAVALIESGEVVVLRTTSRQGKVFETRLWVVDHAGVAWVIPGRASRRWLARLISNPQVELVRGGETRCSRAVPVDAPDVRDKVRDLFREKYRLQRVGAVILNRLFSGQGVPADFVIRLDRCAEDDGGNRGRTAAQHAGPGAGEQHAAPARRLADLYAKGYAG